MWQQARALFWRLVNWTGGGDHADSDEDDPNAHASKEWSTRTIALVGFAIGVGACVSLRQAFGGAVIASTLGAEERVSQPLAGIGAGLCVGLLLSCCSGALPTVAETGCIPTGRFAARSRLADFHAQVVADARAFESDVRITALMGFVLMLVHACIAGPTAALRATAATVTSLWFCVAFCGSCQAHIFFCCLAVPILVTTGVTNECIFGALLGGVACVRFWIRLLQDKLLYHSRRYEDPAAWGKTFNFGSQLYSVQKVAYCISKPFLGDFEQLAFLIRPETKKTTVLWAIHGGNAMLATDWMPHLDRMLGTCAPLGIAFLLLDYPGYGFNKGRPSPNAVLAASKEALSAALSTFDEKPQVNLLGHSLGCAAMAQLAVELSRSHSPAGQLVLSAPFLDIPQMAVRVLGGLLPGPLQAIFPPLVRWLVPHRWNNAVNVPAAAQLGWRVRVVHGAADDLVPCYHGRELYRLATEGLYMGRKVEAHTLKVASLNGACGRVIGIQDERILVTFEHTNETKALRQENLKILDPGTLVKMDGAALTTFTEVANSGHNDVLLAATSVYMEILRTSATSPV